MTSATTRLSDRKLFFLGVNTGFVGNGIPDSRFVKFYEDRSSPQLHCAIIGNIVVPGGFGSNASTPTLSDARIWSTIAQVIEGRGSLPGIQLATAWEGYVGIRRFVGDDPTDVIMAGRQTVGDLGAAGITKVLEDFRLAACMAVDHGFKHVQLHGAHGYLLNLLLDHRINPEADSTLEQISCLAQWLRMNDIESSLRISLRTGHAALDADATMVLEDKLSSLPFDYLDLSSGFYNINKRLIYPSRPDELQSRFQETIAIATRKPSGTFIYSGRAMFNDYDLMPSNVHIGLCRDLIANPNYLNDRMNGCKNKSKCHYFSRGEAHLTCGLW